MVVQVSLSGFWGTDTEHNRRLRIIGAIEEQLERSGLARLGGADSGSGTANLYISKILPEDWERVVELCVGELQRHGVAEGSLVVRDDWSEEAERSTWTVVWPANYEGEFSLFG